MKNSPKISVVMAAYNAEKYLREAIESILTQTFNDFEFIIIDDGSIDTTPIILKEYAKKDKRIKIITHKKNKGLITSLNTGFKKAKGKYIARMDADDISLPERFQIQYDYMEKNPKVVLLGSLVGLMDEIGNVYDAQSFHLADSEIRIAMVHYTQFCHGAVMLRGEIVRKWKELYSEKASHYEDYEYWPRVMKYGLASNRSEILYLYRQIPTSITTTRKTAMIKGTDRIRKREIKKLELSTIDLKNTLLMIKKIYIYKPLYVLIEKKRIRTHLNWLYQSYLLNLSIIYLEKRDYRSTFFIIIASFFVNPLRFSLHLLIVILRSLKSCIVQKKFVLLYHSI